MKIKFTDDIQDGSHVTATIELFGIEWESQVLIDDIPALKKEIAEYDEPKKKVNHTRKFVCPNCGKTKMLDHRKKHWCDCNPRAPFQMTVPNPAIDKLVSGMMKHIK